MPVAVEHEIGDVLENRPREAVAAEEGEDSLGLPLQGRRRRRVVEEDDAQRGRRRPTRVNRRLGLRSRLLRARGGAWNYRGAPQRRIVGA